jgi:hypothetical protein
VINQSVPVGIIVITLYHMKNAAGAGKYLKVRNQMEIDLSHTSDTDLELMIALVIQARIPNDKEWLKAAIDELEKRAKRKKLKEELGGD